MTGTDYALEAIMPAESGDGGVPDGEMLIEFVDRVVHAETKALAELRPALRRALGDAGFVDACATVASFNAVVKIADGSGIPLEEAKADATVDLRRDLSINSFQA